MTQEREFESVADKSYEDFTTNYEDTKMSEFESMIPPSYSATCCDDGGLKEEEDEMLNALTLSPRPTNQYIQNDDVNLQSASVVMDENEVVEMLVKNFESVPQCESYDYLEDFEDNKSIENQSMITDNNACLLYTSPSPRDRG